VVQADAEGECVPQVRVPHLGQHLLEFLRGHVKKLNMK
jgi:hypothetical protein